MSHQKKKKSVVNPKMRPTMKKKNNRKHAVGVIVEDASDSEYENDEYNSPWRNRRPSQGKWIEPVENYSVVA
jgi:hypothetical protein